MSISPSWSRRLAGLLVLELLILAVPGCGPFLTFTPERAAVEALLDPSWVMDKPENITAGSVKVGQTHEWLDGLMVAITFKATEPQDGLVDCLYIFNVTRKESRWAAVPQERDCVSAGGSGELYQRMESQMWGTDIPGMSIAYGLVFDNRILALDILWEDGERQAATVINGTYFWVREGVHETVLMRPLDANGDVVK